MTFDKFLKTAVAAALCLSMAGCGSVSQGIPAAEPSPAAQEVSAQPLFESGEGRIRINEVMAKNRATLQDDSGSYSDWFELFNLTDEDIDLSSWSASDEEGVALQQLGGILPAHGYSVFFAQDFGLSKNETLYVFDGNGTAVSTADIFDDTPDYSIAYDESREYISCRYPTPGLDNTRASFIALQEQNTAVGPIVINEVCVDNYTFCWNEKLDDYPDWVEIKNISSESVMLSDYCLSDDSDVPDMYSLPNISLAPGCYAVILCAGWDNYTGNYYLAPFSLDSESESLFLSNVSGATIDSVALRDIPYGMTYGRQDGENGYFYLVEATPNAENSAGGRYVSETPVALTDSGVFENTRSVPVELSAKGTIFYTTDSTVPDGDSEIYSGPFDVAETGIVRAISVEEGAVPSRTLTLSYIMNEGHELPVVSLVSDNKNKFKSMYMNGYKFDETPGAVSYYGPEGSFSRNCGVKLHGDTSLVLFKPGMSMRFRASYGQKNLKFDLFGGGETKFTSLLLRGGQDQINTVVRNEAVINLAMEFSDSLICQRNRYCVVYIDGVYRGVHALMEKTNEQLYASLYGVSKDSVIENEATVYGEELFYQEVIRKVLYGDMTNPDEYAEICSLLDVDSIIDWAIVEGWCGNYDLADGNLRYYKSTEDDGRWRLALYDLDCAFASPVYCFDNILSFNNQIDAILTNLLKNQEFRTKFLQRASEAFTTYLTDERILAEIDRLTDEIDSEMERDASISLRPYDQWRSSVDGLKNMISNNWTAGAINKLCNINCLNITEEERAQYFGNENS